MSETFARKEPPPGAGPGQAPVYRFANVCVLLVDDDKFMRALITSILKGLGVGRVIHAENGREAADILGYHEQTVNIDIVLSDYSMQPVNGLQLLAWVRGNDNDSIKYLPFIMMSGLADAPLVRAARDRGVTEFLAKPMSVDSVVSRLLAVIDRPRPFVRTSTYFGPDRRRRNQRFDGPEKRGYDEDDLTVVRES